MPNKLFLIQVGTVFAISACIFVGMALLYAEIIDPGQWEPDQPLEEPTRHTNQRIQGIVFRTI
jgi:hypothetical protein